MSGAVLSGYPLAGQFVRLKLGPRFLRAHLLRLTAGSSWRRVVAWMLADFVIVQCAAITALFARLLWLLYSIPDAAGGLVAGVFRCYLGTMVPVLAMFPFLLLLNRCYSDAELQNRQNGGFTLLRACSMASAICALLCSFGRRLEVLEAGSATVFMLLACSGAFGTRWLKWWADSAHARESIPSYVRTLEKARGEPPVLVVGGAGYIGSVLVRRLLAAGRKVRVLDNLVYGNGALKSLSGHPQVELLDGDCRNIKSVVGAVAGVDTIIHLAAIVGDPACEQDREAALETNYAATRMLIEVAKGAKVHKLVFASTCSVYGASEELMDETSPVVPISLYGQTKVQSERALLEAASPSFHPIILRLSTVFGHSYRPRFDLVVNLLTARAHQEGRITIFNGQQWRPFIHVRDVAEGILMVLNMPVSVVGGQIFNLGDSRMNYTLAQVAEKISQVFPRTRVEYVDNDDRRNYRVSFDKIQRLVGFQSSIGLEDGVRELRAAFEHRQIEDYKLALYNNQCFLQTRGSVRNPNEVDTHVMAAFARHFQALAQASGR